MIYQRLYTDQWPGELLCAPVWEPRFAASERAQLKNTAHIHSNRCGRPVTNRGRKVSTQWAHTKIPNNKKGARRLPDRWHWNGGQRWIRTNVGVSQQIYSLPFNGLSMIADDIRLIADNPWKPLFHMHNIAHEPSQWRSFAIIDEEKKCRKTAGRFFSKFILEKWCAILVCRRATV